MIRFSGHFPEHNASQHAGGCRPNFTMRRLAARGVISLVALISLIPSPVASAQQRKSAYDLFPDTAAAVVWIADSNRLASQWERTQLYDLAKDPAIAPFFEEQRQEIESRLIDAGWRLNIKLEDLASYTTGQIGLAWLELPTIPLKPFAMALLADVDDAKGPNDQLMDKIEQALMARKATKVLQSFEGIEIAKYTLPKRPAALLSEDIYYAIVSGHFLSTDDEGLIKELISRIKGVNVASKTIAEDPVFVEGRSQAQISGAGQVEYFVRPLGIARVLRSIGGKHSKSNADMLAVLRNQGFDAIKCVCGEIEFGTDKVDIAHRGHILAERPLPKSAAVLDFPNGASGEVPKFVGPNISTLLTTNWNAEAFWKTEGLVDELAGTPGVFHEVIEGIKVDPNGPRIDIEREVLPHITNDIYSISDSKPGAADIDSRRNLIAIRLSDSAAMAKVLDRAMQNEPDAELVDFNGHTIWKVVHRDDEEVTDLASDFGGDFGAPPAAQAGQQPQPWLSNWAITVYDGYLMFASHVEMIEDAILQAKTGGLSPLVEELDYQRVKAALVEHFGNEPHSAWQVVRTSMAYRVQYELFREGKLMDSQSMLASILDRLLQNEGEMRVKQQKLNGNKLPAYEKVASFLQPGGLMFRSTDSGWSFGVLMLSSPAAAAAIPVLNAQAN